MMTFTVPQEHWGSREHRYKQAGPRQVTQISRLPETEASPKISTQTFGEHWPHPKPETTPI